MTSPNRLKIWKLFDEAHTSNSMFETSRKFSEVFAAMQWQWIDWHTGVKYVPNHSHIFQKIKDLLIDLKIMIDGIPGPIRRNETFFTASGHIKCSIFWQDGSWHLSINLEVIGSEFVA